MYSKNSDTDLSMYTRYVGQEVYMKRVYGKSTNTLLLRVNIDLGFHQVLSL